MSSGAFRLTHGKVNMKDSVDIAFNPCISPMYSRKMLFVVLEYPLEVLMLEDMNNCIIGADAISVARYMFHMALMM